MIPDCEAAPAAARLSLAGPEDTDRVGAALGAALAPGDVVLLTGALGAGKTALTRAAILARLAAVGRAEDVPSPTFTLVQVYDADCPIWHADLYRLSDPDEVWELGLEDAFAEAVVFVEWPDRLGAAQPARRLELTLTQEGEGRLLEARAYGAGWEAALAALGAA